MPDIGPVPAAISWGVVMAAGALLAWRASGPIGRRIDPTSPGRLFVVLFLVSTGIGTLMLTALGQSTGAGAGVAAGGLLAFGLGATAARAAWGPVTPLEPSIEPAQVRPIALIALLALGVACYLAIAIQHGIPFLTADAISSRAAYGGIAFDAFRWLVPPAALLALAAALARPSPRRWAIAGVAFVAVVGTLFLTASRALPAELALAALLLAWWAGRRLSRRAWTALAVLALVFFVGVPILRVGDHGSFRDVSDFAVSTTGRTVERVMLIQARTLELTVVEIPSVEPYYFGSTYVRWLAPLRGEATPTALGTWLFEQLFPGQPVGFATPGLIGELWANGGAVLVLLGLAAFGALAQWLGRLIGRFGANTADRVLAALLVVAVARTYATSLDGFLLTAGVAVAWRLLVAGPTPPAWFPWQPRRARSHEPAAGDAAARG